MQGAALKKTAEFPLISHFANGTILPSPHEYSTVI